jgi:cyclin-dependent kinase-like
VGYKFPESINKPETLDRRYVGKLSKKPLSLMHGMLMMEPDERFTALDCLADSYFDGCRDADIEKMVNNYKN